MGLCLKQHFSCCAGDGTERSGQGAFVFRQRSGEGGAYPRGIIIGTVKTVVKGHGASDAKAVSVCVDQAYRMASGDMKEKVAAGLAAFAERKNKSSEKEINGNV